MKKIIDNITDRLIVFIERLNRAVRSFNDFSNKREFRLIFMAIVLAFMGIQISRLVGMISDNKWVRAVPLVLAAVALFIFDISETYKDKMKARNRVSRMRLVGLNLDFNQQILGRIYRQLAKYGYLDEDLTSFQDFYNVMVLDFDQHDSDLHFNCTLPQLKYILDKFKQLKKGISLKAFERSQKIYHKGNLITAEILSKKYNEFPPDHEFEQLVDTFFDFLGDI